MTLTQSEPTDESLIRELHAGEKGAFVELVRRYKRKVFALASRFARDGDDLEDICQDVFIKVYENIGSFRGDAPFEHWLSRVATRTCYDALRSRKKEKENVPLDLSHHAVADQSSGAELAYEETKNLLYWGLEQLRPDERLVITLLELEEKTVKETAELTGWSEANVKVRAFRARQRLKQLLEKQYER